MGASNGKLRPLLGHRCEPHVEFRPQALVYELQMSHDGTGSRGGRGHQKMRLAQTRGGAIVHHVAIFAQHQAVSDATNRQCGERVGVDKVQKGRGIRPLNVDLP